MCLDLHCIMAFDSRWLGSAAMNLPNDILRGLTALPEVKSEGGPFQRQFWLLKAHVMKEGHLVGASSLKEPRMPLQLRRIGGVSLGGQATEVDGTAAEILGNSDCLEFEEAFATPSGTPVKPP